MKKTKLYLLSGFLGAGKTTFLNNILDTLSEKRVGVIMNEFGKIGIDGQVIQKEDIEMVEINRGSIFCSCLKMSFVTAMTEMADQDLEYLFVESSGLADPSNIGDVLYGLEVTKGDVYDYKGAICLVDGLHFLDQINDIEAVERQLKHCHLIVISKADLIDEEAIRKIRVKIKEINPKADIQIASFGKLDRRILEEDLIEGHVLESEDTTNTPENKPKTLNLTFDKDVKEEDLTRFINSISKDSYRIKGFFKLDNGWNQVDVVNQKIDYKPIDEVKNKSQLVIISKIGPQIIRGIVDNWKDIIGEEMKLR
ncbi:CobW family GTP-binding protein [Wukongibacter sp. M2B1]|uniref:CobW family GTP-binding protein n=1 Tax=Wukongibacter sp. M2B1 TaxID=3088895 RepID=UPI003D7AAE2A